jgi:tetratricopeptide (TPR) repeat protein
LAQTIEFIPREYDNYLFITNIYNVAGDALSRSYFDTAAEWARKGIAVSEFGPGIRYQYAVALNGKGESGAAEEQLRIAADLDPNYAEPRIFLAQLLMERGDRAAALELIEEVQRIRPDYPGLEDLIESAGITGTEGE